MTIVKQIGGGHYGGVEFQHWDFVVKCKVDYLIAVATKYLARWHDKGGILDVQKAISYVDKAIMEFGRGNLKPSADRDALHQNWPLYLETYPLLNLERGATYELFFWKDANDLAHAKETMQQIIQLEVSLMPEMESLFDAMKPDGWVGFTFEGSKKDFSWFRCIRCRVQFQTPVQAPPMLYHECGAEPGRQYVNQNGVVP